VKLLRKSERKKEKRKIMITKSIEIKLPHGLEARPVAELVQLASKYDSTVHIEAQSKKVNAKSIMGMMTLNLNSGEAVTVIAEGSDEEAVVADMENYLQGEKAVKA
jgi:catabolite repression HPr-like protein